VNPKKFIGRLWHSPTLNTWASFATRSLTFVIVLPLLLRRFSAEELAVWYLFATLASLQMLAELGFGSTFVRVIAYGMGGAANLSAAMAGSGARSDGPNLELLGQIVGTMRTIYRRLTLLLAVLLGLGGTWALLRPLAALPEPRAGWISWALVYANTVLVFQGNYFSTWLQGTNQIAVLRRWETFTSLGAILTSFLLLKLGAGLLPLVAATQVWAALGVARNAWLAFQVLDGLLKTLGAARYCPDIFSAVWPSAWRAGIGVAMSQGVTQCSGLIYAQLGQSQSVASYLLALRLQATLASMANAPFASKLPLLSRWWAEGQKDRIVAATRRAMSLTLWAVVVPSVGLGVLGPLLLKWIGSRTHFPNPWVWWLLGAATFAERYGAMHLQLFSLSNRIVWHVANGVTGALAITTATALFPQIEVLALPLGMLIGNVLFYCPYSVRLSRAQFSSTQFPHAIYTILPQLIVLTVSLAAMLAINR
jgi:O-antigen/teichoic acid export membrane protein